MPISENVLIVIFAFFILAAILYIGFLTKFLVMAVLSRLQFKSLCKALENIIGSYTKSKNFDNTMAELEKAILEIVKPNKGFPQACRTISGLLQQYIYWLNTERFIPNPKKSNLLELKESAHSLIELYKSSPFTSDADMYDETLLNSISKSIDKKDFEAAKNGMAELDAIITKKEKKYTFFQLWLPPILTVISGILGAILAELISKILT